MRNLTEVTQKMILIIAVLAGIICLGGLAFFRSIEAFYFANGVILAAVLNGCKVILLEKMVKKLGAAPESYRTHRVYLQFILRFALTAGVLLIGVFVPFVNLFGIAAGIFTLPIAGFAMKLFPNAE